MKLLVLMIVVAFAIYLLGALSAASFDLHVWPKNTRYATACTIAFVLSVVGIVGFLEQPYKRK